MRPTTPLLILVALLGMLGIPAGFLDGFKVVWILLGALLATLALVDGVLLFFQAKVEIVRKIPGRFALGVEQMIEIRSQPTKASRVSFELFDGVPPESTVTGMPWREQLVKGETSFLEYPVRLLKRGRLAFGPCHVLQRSPLHLWSRHYRSGQEEEVRVYPNYEPVVQLSLAAIEHRDPQIGIIEKNRVGLTREFHQLRDYQEGDVLSQIDWKATSRRLQLISREYREQRNQNVVLAVDCGRRMRSIEEGLPQFDHCLNSMLLLSYVSLKQGDRVGILGFGGHDSWLPPQSGEHNMTTILNHLYEYETTPSSSDFGVAAEKILARQQKRALVVILTNLRSEDAGELLPALRLLRQTHLVLLASLRESGLEEEDRVETHEEAVRHAALYLYLEERVRLMENIRAEGILTIDCTADELPLELSNSYLDIKAQGLL